MAEPSIVQEDSEVPTSSDKIKFSDGSEQTFGKRNKSVKEVNTENRTVTFYVKNGQMIVVELDKIPQENVIRLALHGIAQKVGDDGAGVEDIDDIALAFESMRDRLYANEWSAQREKGEFSGVGDLVKAVVEVTGKPVDVVKKGVQEMTAAQKAALKANARVKAVLDRLAEERLAKKGPVDSDALLNAI